MKFLFSIKIFRLIFLPSLLIISAIINHYWNTPSSIIIFSTFTAIYTLYLGYIDYMGNLRKDNRLKYLSEAFINLSSFANRPPPILYEQLIKESLKNNKEINPEILSNIDKEGNFKNQAYNLIAKEYNKNLQEAEKAISIIHLYGTPEEIKLACEFVKNFGDNNPNIEPGNLDKILQKLRDELRKELEYERTEEIIKNLRLERSFPRKE